VKTATPFVLAALWLSGCNPNLRAEMASWARVSEQRGVLERKTAECDKQFGLSDLWKKHLTASNECEPLQAVVTRAAERMAAGHPSADRDFNAAAKAVDNNSACKDEDRYLHLWLEAQKLALPCCATESKELEIRKIEYLAACAKCGVKERCEKNLDHNMVSTAAVLAKYPEMKTPELEKQIREDNNLVFACEK
jgi:hypothetical protein